MFQRSLAIFLIALPLWPGSSATAQGQPNFTGTWVQDNCKGTVPPNWTLKYSNKIEHKEPALSVTTTLSGGTRPDTTFTGTYTLDGKPVVSKDREGEELTTTAQWKGSAIEIAIVEKEGGGEVKSVETWMLSDDGKTLTRTIHTAGPRGVTDRKYILEK